MAGERFEDLQVLSTFADGNKKNGRNTCIQTMTGGTYIAENATVTIRDMSRFVGH